MISRQAAIALIASGDDIGVALRPDLAGLAIIIEAEEE